MTMKAVTGAALAVLLLAALLTAACGGAETPAQPTATPTQPTITEKAPEVTPMQWDSPPPMTIDTDKKYTAHMKTEKGTMVFELFPKEAPKTVNNFVFLAEQGYYNGTTFHRVLEGFMAQGGDPTGTGMGGPGYRFEDEFSAERTHVAGALSMANAGANTNGSQFFITFVPVHQLDGRHTVFGQLVEGKEVLNSITRRDPQANPQFEGDKIISLEITAE